MRRISYTDLDRFRLERLNTLTHKKTERSSADVNRSLTLLRSVLNFAKSSGWITENPFKQGHNPLIRTSTEGKRERVVTFDEEECLLAACTGQRSHVRPLILFALDTAARRSEMLRLQWKDVDLVAGTATLRSYKGRVHTSRSIGLTPRVKAELERFTAVSPDALVFGIKDNFFKAWDSVRDEAKLNDVRLHDLRHTAISRWILSGVQPTIAMALSGHTVFATFKRYVNANPQTAIESAAALAKYQQSQIKEKLITDRIN